MEWWTCFTDSSSSDGFSKVIMAACAFVFAPKRGMYIQAVAGNWNWEFRRRLRMLSSGSEWANDAHRMFFLLFCFVFRQSITSPVGDEQQMCYSGAIQSQGRMWDPLSLFLAKVRVTYDSLHLQRDPPLGFRDLDQDVPWENVALKTVWCHVNKPADEI